MPKPDPETYNPETSEWPYQRYGHTVVAWRKYVILFGGRSDIKVSPGFPISIYIRVHKQTVGHPFSLLLSSTTTQLTLRYVHLILEKIEPCRSD